MPCCGLVDRQRFDADPEDPTFQFIVDPTTSFMHVGKQVFI
jgi:hypothetical protein